jgi:hypothetical protein
MSNFWRWKFSYDQILNKLSNYFRQKVSLQQQFSGKVHLTTIFGEIDGVPASKPGDTPLGVLKYLAVV